jgi:cytochrome c biogenesis protein ResB
VRFLAQKPLSAKQARVRVRLTVEGRAEEFWLARLMGDPGDTLPAEEQRVVEHNGRRVSVALVPDEVDLGFRVRLERFNRKLDPGTGQASHYSSTIDILDRHTDKVLRRDVLITLNEPVNFSDPVTGRSFRLYQASFSGPFRPGDAAFESVAGTTPREQIFASVLSANYDPGRGMKYAGSLLIVVGVFLVFYLKTYFFVKRPDAGAHGASRI